MRTFGRRTVLASILAGVTLGSACGGGNASGSSGTTAAGGAGAGGDANVSGDLNLIAYAGVWEDQYKVAVIEPFKKKFPNVKVNYVSKRSSAEMLSALQGQKGKPQTDVSIMDISVSESGNNQGLFEKVDKAALPNLANVKSEFLNKDGFGPVVMLDAVGLLYDTAVVKEAPTSWNILWEPQYKGKVNVVAPPSFLGITLTAVTASMVGEDYTQSIEKATARLKELAPSIQSYAPNPDEYQSVITGQTVLGLGQGGRGNFYSDQSNKKLGVAFPKEGTSYQINTINLVKGAPNPAAAKAFMDFALSAPAQEEFAAKMFYAPSISNANLPDAVKSRVVPTDGSLKVLPLDVAFLAANRDKWTDVWKRQIIPTK